jgi:hypothetical protein
LNVVHQCGQEASFYQPNANPSVVLEHNNWMQTGLLEAGCEQHCEVQTRRELAIQDIRSGVRIFWPSFPNDAGGFEYWMSSATSL